MKLLIFVIGLVIIPFFTIAQLINVESKRRADQDGLHGSVSLALDIKQNTRHIFQTNSNIVLQYQKRVHTLLFLNEMLFLHVDNDNALVNSWHEHLRYNYALNQGMSRITLEAFVQHQYNRIKLLKARVINGYGPRIRTIGYDVSPFRLYTGLLFMYEYEKLFDFNNDLSNDELITSRIKGDFYLSTSYNFSGNASISDVVYYQPWLKNWNDYRISNDIILNFKISEKFVISMFYGLEYDSSPPVNKNGEQLIPKLFYSINNKLTFSF